MCNITTQYYCIIIVLTLIDLTLGLVLRAAISAQCAWLSCSLCIVYFKTVNNFFEQIKYDMI